MSGGSGLVVVYGAAGDAHDDFNHNETDQWGIPSGGDGIEEWSMFPEVGGGVPTTCFQVAGGFGSMAYSTDTGGVQRATLGNSAVTTGDYPWMTDSYTMTVRFKFSGIDLPDSDLAVLHITPRRRVPGPGSVREDSIEIQASTFDPFVFLSGLVGSGDDAAATVWANDVFYLLTYERTSSAINVEILREDTEVTTTLTATTSDNSHLSSRFEVAFTQDLAQQLSVLYIDYIAFGADPVVILGR